MRELKIYQDSNEIMVQFDYQPILVDVIKRIPERKYEPEKKYWSIKKCYSDYVSKFVWWCLKKRYILKVVRQELEAQFELPELQPYKSEHGLLLEPYPYQLEGIDYIVKHKNVLIGDQMGLGKTLQAIAGVNITKSYPCLIICKSGLKYNWLNEVKKFLGEDAIVIDKKNKDSLNDYISFGTKFFITNYEYLKQPFCSVFEKNQTSKRYKITLNDNAKLFKSLIVDESHYCRTNSNQWTKIIKKISKNIDMKLLITGTPMVNNYKDYIPQLEILGQLEAFGGYKKFNDRYCAGEKKCSNAAELNFLLWNTCYFHREKHKVLKDLPSKSRQYISLDITNRKEYDDCERDLANYLKQYKKATDTEIMRSLRGEIMVKMTTLKYIAAKGKLKAVVEFIKNTTINEKLVMFGFLKEIVNSIEDNFKNISVRITGNENAKQKQLSKDRFQAEEDIKLAILNYKSGKEGVTLTASSKVAFIEFPWTWADCEQAEDRVHRIGQKNNVNCYYFIGKDTIDEYIISIIQSKKELSEAVTLDEDVTNESKIELALNYFENKNMI